MKKYFYIFALITLLLTFSCRKNVEKELPFIKIGHVGHDHQIALFIAIDKCKEFQDKTGIIYEEEKEKEIYKVIENGKPIARIQLIKVGGGSRMPASMEKGSIQIGYGGVAAVAKFIDNGRDFKIIAPLQTDGDVFVLHKDFPAENWEDFIKHVKQSKRPVKIGYKAPVAVAKIIFENALKHADIKFGTPGTEGIQIEMINAQGQKNLVPTLSKKGIDGFVSNEPAPSKSVYKKVGKKISDLNNLPPKGKWYNHPCCCIASTDEFIKKQPDIIKALLKTNVVATNWINENRDESIKIASDWTKLDIEIEKMSIPYINYGIEPNKKWKKAMGLWYEHMNSINYFKNKLKGVKSNMFLNKVTDFKILEEILKKDK